jgi:RNA-directed DNA polymerase
MAGIRVERGDTPLARNIIRRESGQTSARSFMAREQGKPLNEGEQMTADAPTALAARTDAGAPSRSEVDWVKIHREVRRLQVRIAKATQEGRWGKVKALQRLLTHSYSGKMLAVKRVTQNRGKNTPGVDGTIWRSPAAKSRGVESLRRRGYQPMPLRRTYIPKSNGKKRPLGIPIMKDRAMQALWKLALEPIAETTADPNSYGFRPARSTADAIGQCFNLLVRSNAVEWILEGDIRGCFDNISHEWLLENIPMDREILRKWLKAGFIDKNTFFATEDGTPQGGIISPVLANMALDGLEETLRVRFGNQGSRRSSHRVHVVRYADDFIVTGASRGILETEVRPVVEQFLSTRGLELSEEKTRITHIEEGFDFLGQNVRKYNGKLLIKPSKKSVKAFLGKVRGVVKANKTAHQRNLILLLNPIIRGWAQYHRHVVASRTFATVDHRIWRTLWYWSKRRHPDKSAQWIMERYFRKRGSRTWVFGAKERLPDGTHRWVDLFYAADVLIRRHPKIKRDANPFDPVWDDYLARRRRYKVGSSRHDRGKLV